METKTSMPSLLDLSNRPAINTSLWRAGFSGMGTSLPAPVHRWAAPARSGKSSAWPKGWVAVAFFPFVLLPSTRSIPASSPFQHFCHLPFSKGFIYTAFMLFCLMKIVWICAFQTARKRDPPFSSLAVKCLLCYSPKNWFRLFKGLFFTALSPRVDARQAALIFSEFEVIVLNWQTKHFSPLVFHFYH